jgi:hypothetical protein
MAVLRALPNRAWSAVVALVVLASLGVAVVLGAGLDAWRGTVDGSSLGSPSGLSPNRAPGVITLPGAPRHGGQPQSPQGPTTPADGDGVVGPVSLGPSQPVPPAGDGTESPGSPTDSGGESPTPDEGPGVTPEPPTTGHPGTPAGAGQGDFKPLPGTDEPKPALDGDDDGHGKGHAYGHGKHGNRGKHLAYGKHHGHGHGLHRGHGKHHHHKS